MRILSSFIFLIHSILVIFPTISSFNIHSNHQFHVKASRKQYTSHIHLMTPSKYNAEKSQEDDFETEVCRDDYDETSL